MKAIVITGCLSAALATFGPLPSTAPVDSNSETIKVLWRDPGAIAQKDLYWGPGSEASAPKAPFTFVKEDVSGTKPKIEVTDAGGSRWSIKLVPLTPEDNEVHAEIAATRLVWAFGYFVDENYFVPEGRIDGVTGLKRAADVVGTDGRFRTARFERIVEGRERGRQWDIENNTFNGTRELSGAKILMMLLGNWDLHTGNTVIERQRLPNGDTEERYLISDLGSTFGRMSGGVMKKHSRWNLRDYAESKNLNGIVAGKLEFRYPLMGTDRMAVPLEHARWFAAMAAQLSPAQVRRAFEASGATPEEIEGFSSQLVARLDQLRTVVEKK